MRVKDLCKSCSTKNCPYPYLDCGKTIECKNYKPIMERVGGVRK